MNFVITMAGRGDRFRKAGYTDPKWKIEVHGKSLLEWSISSLPLELCTRLIFVCLKEHIQNNNLDLFLKTLYGDKKEYQLYIIPIDEVTDGQAQTVLFSEPYIDSNESLLIYNIDTKFSSLSLINHLLERDIDGVLGAFHSSLPQFSYAKTDTANKFVTETKEKEVISEYALTGLYHFKNSNDFFEAANYFISNNIRTKNEFYIAPMYNYLIGKNKKFIVDVASSIDILGTPDEVEIFKNSTL